MQALCNLWKNMQSELKKIIIPINTLVDKNIAPLVLALNKIENVVILDSCEHFKNCCKSQARIVFTYKQNHFCNKDLTHLHLAALINRIHFSHLPERVCYPYSFSIEWTNATTDPVVMICCSNEPEHIKILSEEITRISVQINLYMREVSKHLTEISSI